MIDALDWWEVFQNLAPPTTAIVYSKNQKPFSPESAVSLRHAAARLVRIRPPAPVLAGPPPSNLVATMKIKLVEVSIVLEDGKTQTAQLYPDPSGKVIGYRVVEAYRYLNVDAEEEVAKLKAAWEMVFPGAPFLRPL